MKKLELKRRKIKYDSLEKFGFIKVKDNLEYHKSILNNDFDIVIVIKENEVFSYIFDNNFNEEYFNINLNTSGEFINSLKQSYEEVINDFFNKCTSIDTGYSNQVKTIIKYINDKYQDNIEYLWESFPTSGIFRNKKNNKWYAVIMSVKENKVGGETEKEITVIDLSYYKGETEKIIDNKKIWRGYHMNKNSWITIKLDGTVDNELIFKHIDISYEISIKK